MKITFKDMAEALEEQEAIVTALISLFAGAVLVIIIAWYFNNYIHPPNPCSGCL
jgi:hypothetical protein